MVIDMNEAQVRQVLEGTQALESGGPRTTRAVRRGLSRCCGASTTGGCRARTARGWCWASGASEWLQPRPDHAARVALGCRQAACQGLPRARACVCADL